MIPLILLDLDGTVIGSSGTVQSCIYEAVERVRTAGVKIAVCTGRPCNGVAKKVAARFSPNGPHIFQSGALIAYADGEVLHVSALKEAVTRALIEHARDHALVLELYTTNALFVERKTPMSEAHAKMIGVTAIVRDLQDVAEDEPVVRAQWVLKPEQVSAALALELDGVQLSPASSPALENTRFVSVTQKGVSKGSATRRLAETLKVKLENVMAIGDGEGDVPMLELVGHPVVMENAAEALKARFERVAGTVEDCGIVDVLEEALQLKIV